MSAGCETLLLYPKVRVQVHALLTAPARPGVPSSELEMDATDRLRFRWYPPNTYQESRHILPHFLSPANEK